MGPEWWEDLPEEWTSQDVADMADLLGFACRAMADEHLMEFTPTEMADWVGLTEAGGYDTLVSVALDKTMRAGLRDIVQEVGPLGSNTPLDIDLEELLEELQATEEEGYTPEQMREFKSELTEKALPDSGAMEELLKRIFEEMEDDDEL